MCPPAGMNKKKEHNSAVILVVISWNFAKTWELDTVIYLLLFTIETRNKM